MVFGIMRSEQVDESVVHLELLASSGLDVGHAPPMGVQRCELFVLFLHDGSLHSTIRKDVYDNQLRAASPELPVHIRLINISFLTRGDVPLKRLLRDTKQMTSILVALRDPLASSSPFLQRGIFELQFGSKQSLMRKTSLFESLQIIRFGKMKHLFRR